MPVLPVFIYGEKILRKRSVEVAEVTRDLAALAQNMLETMYKAPGIGLAAPQVGKSIRLIVVDVKNYEEDEKAPIVFFNPEIIDSSGEVIDEEGCLSFPGLRVRVKRPEFISVKALDLAGKEFTLNNAGGLLSRCIQHEMDHLDGILFVDRISKADKLLLAAKLKKLAKEKRLS
jgi:peptide deformylase